VLALALVPTGGTEVDVVRVHRDIAQLPNKFHLVDVVVKYEDLTGEQAINPGDDLSLLDPAGTWHATLGLQDEQLLAICQDRSAPAFPETLAPGAHADPFSLCFQAGGPTTGRLLVMYTPAPVAGCDPAFGEPFVPGATPSAHPAATGSPLIDHPDQFGAAVIGLAGFLP
jgi:hypothetical protein